MAERKLVLLDLPEDILAIVFSFLDAKSFLSFCRTCRSVYQYRQDPAFWRVLTSSTFRLPVSPLLKADGPRWYWLYKRLRTQTKLYTWGKGVKGNLGQGRSPADLRGIIGGRRGRIGLPPRQIRPNPRTTYQRTGSSWPTETHVPDEVGVIADLQCGGWSTSILSSEGNVYAVGVIDSADGMSVGEGSDEFQRLEYLTQSTSAIKQFSSGRRHILALTDDGEILSWDRLNAKGLKIFSRNGRDFGGKAVRVVAGWGESSAYIPETGIVFWIPVKNNQRDQMLDGQHIKEKVIPGTARRMNNEHQVVEVVTHVVLESWIVWLTSDGHLFACELHTNNPNQEQPTFHPFEVPGYTSSVRVLQDVQGQFKKFVVFTNTGEVLAGDTDYLRLCAEKARFHTLADDQNVPEPPGNWAGLDALINSRPRDIPALQHNKVISVAFGDHHYHALHVNGTITSYGSESQSCGSLGLGDQPSGSKFRGLLPERFGADSKLLPQAERRGRQIWFEPEKRDWLAHMEDLKRKRSTQPDQASWNDPPKLFMFSEWVEQEGRHWQDGPSQTSDITKSLDKTQLSEQDFHLDPYFALAVSAAGWHSGALVLVDEDKAHATREKWTKMPEPEIHQEDEHDDPRKMPGHFEPEKSEPREEYIWKLEGFPRVRLPGGFEMPGDGEVRRWRDGMPSMAELGVTRDTP